jgi:hypothetical protein
MFQWYFIHNRLGGDVVALLGRIEDAICNIDVDTVDVDSVLLPIFKQMIHYTALHRNCFLANCLEDYFSSLLAQISSGSGARDGAVTENQFLRALQEKKELNQKEANLAQNNNNNSPGSPTPPLKGAEGQLSSQPPTEVLLRHLIKAFPSFNYLGRGPFVLEQGQQQQPQQQQEQQNPLVPTCPSSLPLHNLFASHLLALITKLSVQTIQFFNDQTMAMLATAFSLQQLKSVELETTYNITPSPSLPSSPPTSKLFK